MRLSGSLLALGLALVSSVHAAPVQTPHVEAELVSAVRSIEPGKPFTVALRLQHDEHWHTYWKNPGDSGMATAIEWTLAGWVLLRTDRMAGAAAYSIPPLTNFGYEGEILLLTEIRPPPTWRRAVRSPSRQQPSGWCAKRLACPAAPPSTFPYRSHAGRREPDPRWGPAARPGA